MNRSPRYWLVVPAAGIGSRFNSDTPKQYLSLAGKTVLENTLHHFLSDEKIERIFLTLNPNDSHWKTLSTSHHSKVEVVEGGEDRHISVFNALKVLKEIADSEDFVLVHDAARPCITPSDIDSLIESTKDHAVGGLLGAPVTDTLKNVGFEPLSNTDTEEKPLSKPVVLNTINRQTTWSAYTPQIFRFRILYEALRTLVKSETSVTDESMAIEYAGYQPLLVKGRSDNIKVTVPEDLDMAEKILESHRKNFS
ncbi:MAG: 2-C-methyl-D-erythritol 4-phosphate cytidylyltransferase [Cellvibrionaceae bacterium]